MEYLDTFDESMVFLGKMPKNEVHKTGAWHRTIHCWIVRSDETGQYVVFQKRSATKKSFPNFLDISAAGHYQSGEKIWDGVREIVEELGVDVSFSDLLYLGIKFDVYKETGFLNREYCETFLYQDNRSIYDYPIDCEEVTGMAQIKIQDGLNLFSNKVNSIRADGMEYSYTSGKIERIELTVTRDSFIKGTSNNPIKNKNQWVQIKQEPLNQ